MFVGDKVRVVRLERETDEDRDSYVERDGELIQKLNVPWEPDLGSLWRVRFEKGVEAIFAEAELVELDGAGRPMGSEIEDLKESWGQAPRTTSMRFKRAGVGATGILAFLAFLVAGLLLVVAGIATSDMRISAAGATLVVVGVGAAVVLVR